MGRLITSEEVPVARQEVEPVGLEGKLLDEARAEFRAAWRAKSARASRYRAWAAKVDKSAGFMEITILIVTFVFACVVVMSLSDGTFQLKRFRGLSYGFLGCLLVRALIERIGILINRRADRLEAAEIDCVRPSRERTD